MRGGQNLPACYVTNLTPVLEAKFTVVPDRITSCTLFATGGPFGGIEATNVAFAGGESGFVRLSAAGTTGNLLNRTQYNLKWNTSALNNDAFSDHRFQQSFNHVLYAIFGEPLLPWKSNPYGDDQNAWTNALEFAIAKTGAKGKATKAAALAEITQYLHSDYGLRYDTEPVAFNFAQRMEGGAFNLSGYLTKAVQLPSQPVFLKDEVNCYDQAGALVSLGCLLGINVKYKYMSKFGYINPTALVDLLVCNNPFYPMTTSKEPYTGLDDIWPARSFFSRHAFSLFEDRVYDACVGPIINCSLTQYLDVAIDDSTDDENLESGKDTSPATGTVEEVY